MMNEHSDKKDDNVACEVCLTEIPESVAMSSEGDEYTQHFCGIECYEKWREKDKPQKSAENNSN